MLTSKWVRASVVGCTIVLSGCNPFAGNLSTTTVENGYLPGLPNSEKEKTPVAIDLALATNKNVAGSSHLPASDDNANDTLTFKLVTLPTIGAVTITDQASGAFTYTPNLNAIGSDSFTFKASDGKLESNTATVTITINDTFAAPVSTNITPAALNEDVQSGVITLPYTDPDGDLATACTIYNPQNVSVTQSCACNGAGVCTVKVTGLANYNGPASFDYSVTANGAVSNTATASLTINSVEDAPTTSAISPAAFNEDTQSGLITLSYTAVGGDIGTTCTISNLSNVTVTQACACSGTGVCTLKVTGTANYYGSAGFDYTVSAGTATSNTSAATLSIAQLGDDALTANAYGFDTGDHANYDFADGNGSSSTILGSVLSFASNLVKLIKADQIDNSTYGFGAGHGESFTGGAQYDSSTGREYVRLSTTSPNLELDASWTPAWSNLIGYWKLNGAAGASASGASVASGMTGGLVGTGSGTGLTYVLGTINEALNFNGVDDAVTVPHSAAWNFSHFTFSAWVKSTDFSSGGQILDRDEAGVRQFQFRGNGSNLQTILFSAGSPYAFSSTGTINDGKWHLVCATYDGSWVTSYVDGVTSGTTAFSLPIDSGVSSLFIGRHGYANAFMSGSIDEPAIWNVALSAAAIKTIYQHQSAKYTGTISSRVMDAFSAGQSWTSFAWTPTLPFYKALPDAGLSESQSSYASLASDTLMNGILGLWHFDEIAGTAGAGSIKDQSGQSPANNGTPSGVVFGKAGALKTAASFDGGGVVTVSTSTGFTTHTAMTMSAWVQPALVDGSQRIIFDGAGDSRFRLAIMSGNNFRGWFGNSSVGWSWAADSTTLATVNRWYHIVATIDPARVRIYINGKKEADNATASVSISAPAGTSTIGSYSGGGYNFVGLIDELGVWNRALSPSEAMQLYRRGANRIQYQVRSCSDAACSCKTIAVGGSANDCDGDGVANASDLNDANLAQWLGPDGTNQSYFSELNNTDTYNTASSTSTGAVLPTLPSLSFAKFGAPLTTNLANNRYFQYRAILESDDANNLCDYGGGPNTAPCSPELTVVGIGPDHYSKDKPYLIGKNPVAFYNLSGFTEALSMTPGCAGGVKYQLSNDKTTWKWWDGTAWLTTSNTNGTDANTATQLNTTGVISSFPGPATVYFRAFLGSDGTQPCELDSVTFSGLK